MSNVKKALKWVAATYAICFVIACLHFPRSTRLLIEDGHWGVSLSGIIIPKIVNSYGEFIYGRVWPYQVDENAIPVRDLLRSRSEERGTAENEIMVDIPNENGWHDRYFLGEESFSSSWTNGLTEWGQIITIGQFSCLSEQHQFLSRPKCVRLLKRGKKVFWQQVGKDKLLPASVDLLER